MVQEQSCQRQSNTLDDTSDNLYQTTTFKKDYFPGSNWSLVSYDQPKFQFLSPLKRLKLFVSLPIRFVMRTAIYLVRDILFGLVMVKTNSTRKTAGARALSITFQLMTESKIFMRPRQKRFYLPAVPSLIT